jgi:uncharacterized oligopeptide transporter (OPT) family protein
VGREQAQDEDAFERQWFAQVYRGDDVPQLTLRAVLTGGLIGMLLSLSTIYMTMKVGMAPGVAITSCVLCYLGWGALRGLSAGRISQLSILEANCMQSTASSAGSATATTVAVTFAALRILDPVQGGQSWWVVALFTAAASAMGVLLAIPIKRQFINREHLPFPSGTAAALTLQGLYRSGADAIHRAYSLLGAMLAAVVAGILSTAEDQFAALGRFFQWMRSHLFEVHLPGQVPGRGIVALDGKPMMGFGFEPGVMLVGLGMIIGPRVAFSMLFSSAAMYLFVAPWLHGLDLVHAGEAGYRASLPVAGGGAFYLPLRWSLWGGASVLVFSGLAALALQWRAIGRAFTSLVGASAQSGDAAAIGATDKVEIPMTWMLVGLVPACLAMLFVQVFAFGIAWWVGVVAMMLTFVLSVVSARAVGETDIAPNGPLGKIMQLVIALIAPAGTAGTPVGLAQNVASAGLAANSAVCASDMLNDLKSGYVLGANPRRQFIAQTLGILFGVAACVPAWFFLIPDAAALDSYPMPAAQVWAAVARALANGISALVPSIQAAIVIGAVVGVLIPILEQLLPRARRWLPSATGLGLGWVVFFSTCLSIALGSALALAWRKIAPVNEERYRVPVAAGFIAGESLIKAALAVAAGVIAATS